jgi:AAA15 family ATPase/GTPase
MFIAIELKNFKSFGHIRFDFKKKEKEYKKFIALYGENGSGKSNFVTSIVFLAKTLSSLSDKQMIKKLKEHLEKNNNDTENTDFLEFLKNYDQSLDFNEYRTIGSSQSSVVRFEFVINGTEGYYDIEFQNEILRERLYFMCSKQRGFVFDVWKENGIIQHSFNSSTFTDEKYEEDILDKMKMYWGKHTFLSIIMDELHDKNENYVKERVSPGLIEVIDKFTNAYIFCRDSKYVNTGVISGSKIRVKDFDMIEVNKNAEDEIKQIGVIENIIREFFTQTYSDINDVFYRSEEVNTNNVPLIRYKLFVKKNIAGEEREIPFSLESAGTQSVLSVLRAMIEVIDGKTVIFDEIDNGIHDLLMKNILFSVKDEIEGQLIITTHNTLLLEMLDISSVYIIYCDSAGNKEARCFKDYDVRIQKTNNARKMYLDGVFGGIPYVNNIDYSNMHIMTNSIEVGQ